MAGIVTNLIFWGEINMTKLFKCQKCSCNQVGIMRDVLTFQKVETDEDGNIVYFEDEEPIWEEYTAYVCADCGRYLSLDGVIITDEKALKEYLEQCGVEADTVPGEKQLENISEN